MVGPQNPCPSLKKKVKKALTQKLDEAIAEEEEVRQQPTLQGKKRKMMLFHPKQRKQWPSQKEFVRYGSTDIMPDIENSQPTGKTKLQQKKSMKQNSYRESLHTKGHRLKQSEERS